MIHFRKILDIQTTADDRKIEILHIISAQKSIYTLPVTQLKYAEMVIDDRHIQMNIKETERYIPKEIFFDIGWNDACNAMTLGSTADFFKRHLLANSFDFFHYPLILFRGSKCVDSVDPLIK